MLADTKPYEHIVAQALANTVNGVVITDARQAGNPIVHVNSGFTRLTGYARDDVIGRNCNFLQGTERLQPEVQQLRAAIASGQATMVVIKNFKKDGTPFWNQVELSPVRDADTGEITHYFALQTDVTLKLQAERATMLRALDLERMFRGGPLGMILLSEDRRVSLATPATWRLLGLPVQWVQGWTEATLKQCLGAHLPPQAGELPWPSAAHPVRWEVERDGRRSRLDVSLFDIGTVSKDQVLVLRDTTQEEADQSNRAEFLATAAHELRTPLGSITGFTELLLMRAYPPEKARPLLETILRHAVRLGALLNDLLDLSHMDALGAQAFLTEPVALREVVHKAVQIAVPPQSQRTITIDVPDPSPSALAHPQKLEQVLINLLSNALKYSPDGGPVHVTVLQDDLDRLEGRVSIAVQDQGMGLSEADQQRLFTRFFRAQPQGPIPGTGLGLVIVKELVERMGGSIHVCSRLGQGSTFTLRLPLAGATS